MRIIGIAWVICGGLIYNPALATTLQPLGFLSAPGVSPLDSHLIVNRHSLKKVTSFLRFPPLPWDKPMDDWVTRIHEESRAQADEVAEAWDKLSREERTFLSTVMSEQIEVNEPDNYWKDFTVTVTPFQRELSWGGMDGEGILTSEDDLGSIELAFKPIWDCSKPANGFERFAFFKLGTEQRIVYPDYRCDVFVIRSSEIVPYLRKLIPILQYLKAVKAANKEPESDFDREEKVNFLQITADAASDSTLTYLQLREHLADRFRREQANQKHSIKALWVWQRSVLEQWDRDLRGDQVVREADKRQAFALDDLVGRVRDVLPINPAMSENYSRPPLNTAVQRLQNTLDLISDRVRSYFNNLNRS